MSQGFEISHKPQFDVDKVIAHYQEKDGVPIQYICTSDVHASDVPCDVFYRETPHPEFGNRYFGLYYDKFRGHMMITNADIIEDLEFGMIKSDGKWHYSKSHHHYNQQDTAAIDGGRAYIRIVGNSPQSITLVVKDGQFVTQEWAWQDSGIEGGF